MRWLAYVHPALMLLVLALALFVLREGLRVRRARLARRSFDSTRHRRLARVLALAVPLGFALGLTSMGWLRGESVAGSVHFPFAAGATIGIGLAATLGLRLERGASLRTRTVHAICGAIGVLLALGAGIAGLAILP